MSAKPKRGAAPGREVIPIDDASRGPRAMQKLLLGLAVPHEEIDGLPVDWLNFAAAVRGTADGGQRRATADTFLATVEATDPRQAAAMRYALATVANLTAADLGSEGGPTFSLGLIDSATFFDATHPLDWLARGALVKGEPCIVGGPSKSLKTSILCDLAISLASADPFLGRFDVPRPFRVAFISGESGQRSIQATAREILKSKGLAPSDVPGILWGFTLPQLANAAHLAVLNATIRDGGIEAVVIDPLYLSLLAGNSEIDPKSMFAMGPLLADVATACLAAGATPILCHHTVKRRESPYEPTGLDDLAYSGSSQFARQWMLIGRRERYDAESAVHKLHFGYGGSAGHSGELQLDIDAGRVDDDLASGRRWVVTVATPSEGIEAAKDRRRAEQEAKAAEKAEQKRAEKEREEAEWMAEGLDVFRKAKGGFLTVRKLRDAMNWNKEKAERVVYLLAARGRVRPDRRPVETRPGHARDCDGYTLIPGGGETINEL